MTVFAAMLGYSSVMFGWSWTEVSVLGSQVFGQASVDSWDNHGVGKIEKVYKIIISTSYYWFLYFVLDKSFY